MKGNILVSSPSLLSDTVFYKSIILIIDDSDNSHTGFILNKPGGLFFIKNESGKLNRNYKFNFGGPVSEETFFIIKNHNLYSQNFKITENLFWGNDVEMIIKNNQLVFYTYSRYRRVELETLHTYYRLHLAKVHLEF